jgi:hypothetical protein
MPETPRGIRNNNPGNIERVKGVIWEGQSSRQTDRRFITFDSPVYGIRAIARVLITYADARKAADGSKIDTVQEVITRWAPPHENDTTAYSEHVAKKLGVGPGAILNIKRADVMAVLIESIVQHENGEQPYSDSQITKGMMLAGIEAEFKPMNKSRTLNGGRIAGVGASATTVAGAASAVAPALPVLEWFRDNMAIALMAVGIATLVGVGYMIWARYDDREKGLR